MMVTRTDTVGSVLVEALVGIGMLAIITASLLTFSRSWLTASEASHVLSEGLVAAGQHLADEVLTDAPVEPVRTSPDRPFVTTTIARWSSGRIAADDCGVSGPAGVGGSVVDVTSPSTGTQQVLRLAATRLEVPRRRTMDLAASVPPGSLRIDGAGVDGRSFLVGAGDQQVSVTADSEGCLPLHTLGPGRHVFRPAPGDARPPLIDESHRTGAELHLERSILDRPITGVWALSEAAQVRVEIDASGARPPDQILLGTFGWMVRGDDARISTAIGATRPLHPGPTTLVVSACTNPESIGSSATVDVAAGEDVLVAVPLAVVTLDGLAGRPDEAVTASRLAGCSDGSGLRPALTWVGGLADGMRIALPHGYWEISVQPVGSLAAVGAVRVHAGEPGASASLP